MPPGCFALVFLFLLVFLLPFFLADVVLSAMQKLGLSPATSLAVGFGIFFGGLLNLPIKRYPREGSEPAPTIDVFGVGRWGPQWALPRPGPVLAVNVGGCIVPSVIACYELARVATLGPGALAAALLAVGVNVALCHRLARPLPGVGIAMPALVPGIAAAACALLFSRDLAPPVAFSAGVLGPLVGADLLHLRDIRRIATGVASIGGAGTFDGIVISGLIATLLA
jgi:uncharacterized membrane protein